MPRKRKQRLLGGDLIRCDWPRSVTADKTSESLINRLLLWPVSDESVEGSHLMPVNGLTPFTFTVTLLSGSVLGSLVSGDPHPLSPS